MSTQRTAHDIERDKVKEMTYDLWVEARANNDPRLKILLSLLDDNILGIWMERNDLHAYLSAAEKELREEKTYHGC